MGRANVAAAFAIWGRAGLSHRAFRLLVFMANVSLDKEDGAGRSPRVYFGGSEALATSLGYDRPDDSGQRQVRKCLTELRRAGVLRDVRAARSGAVAEYELLLWELPRQQDRNGPTQEDRRGPTQQDRNGPVSRTETVLSAGPERSSLREQKNNPRTQEEQDLLPHHLTSGREHLWIAK